MHMLHICYPIFAGFAFSAGSEKRHNILF